MIYIIFNAPPIISNRVGTVKKTDVWDGSSECRRSKIDILEAGCIKTRWGHVEGVCMWGWGVGGFVDRRCKRPNWEWKRWGERAWGKEEMWTVKQRQSTDLHANHSFQLTREKSYTAGMHNETTGPSLKSRGRKTEPSRAPPDCRLLLPPRETRLVELAPLLSALS